MDMEMAATPTWLTVLSWAFVALALLCAAAVLFDIHGRGHRQRSRALELMWPLAALATGPLALALYRRFGDTTASAGLPGGVASGIAHVIGVPLVVATGLTIAGLELWAMIAVIAVIAVALLAGWELLVATVPARGLRLGRGLPVALLVALVTVLAFDVGMGGWMLLLHFGLEFMPPASDVAFVFLMQVGIVLGFLTGLPAVAWLRSRGVAAAV